MANLWDPEGNPVSAPDDEGALAELQDKGYRIATPEEVAAAQSGGPVSLVSPDYEASSVDGANLGKVLTAGYRLATADELATGEIYNPETPGGMLRTGIEGLLAGPTGGLSNLAQRYASGIAGGLVDAATGGELDFYDQAAADRTGSQIQTREAVNPGLSGTAKVAGIAGALVLSKGKVNPGTTGTAAATLTNIAKMTPAAKLASLGTLIAESMGASPALQSLGRAGAALVGATTAGVEGAADTALNTITQDMLDGKWDLTVDRLAGAVNDIALSAGVAVLFGGAVGAATFKKAIPTSPVPEMAPPTGIAPKLLLQSSDDELAQVSVQLDTALSIGDHGQAAALATRVEELSVARERAIADSLFEPIDSVTSRTTPTDHAEVKSAWAKIGAPLTAAKSLAEGRAALDEVLATETRAITDDLNKFQRNVQDVLEPAFDVANFRPAARRVLAAEPVIITPEITARLTNSLQDLSDGMAAIIDNQKSMFGGAAPAQLGKIPQALEAVNSLRKRLYTPVEGSTLARIVDPAVQADVYADIMTVRRYIGKVAKPKEGPGTAAQRSALMPAYAALKSIELDTRIWPKTLVQMRDETHAAITEMIPTARPINALLGTDKGLVNETAGPGKWQMFKQIWSPKVGSYLEGTAKPVNYQADEIMATGLLRQVEWAETMSKWFNASPAQRAAVAEQRMYAENVLRGIREVKTLHAMVQRFDIEASKAKNIGAVVGVLESAFLGLPMGVGNITSGLLRSVRWATRDMHKVAGAAAAGEAQVDGFVKKAFKNVLAGTVESARHGMTAAAVTRAMTEAEAMQDPESPQRQALSQQVDMLRDGEGDELAAAVEEASLRRHNFIMSKVTPPDDSDPLTPGRPAAVSPAKQASDARYIEAAYDPMSAFQRMASGAASKEDIETMKVVFPAIYQNFAERLVAKAAASKQPLDIRQRQRLHRITSVPTSASHAPQRFIRLQEIAITMQQPKDPKGAAPAPSGAKGKGKVDYDGLMSRSDELASGGE